MSILDVRQCGGVANDDNDDGDWSFVEGMTTLEFTQLTQPRASGFFTRPARCSVDIVDRWVRQFSQ
jgi:hypothetical protein